MRRIAPRSRAHPERVVEARLLAAARKGDARALGELLERASGPAYRFSRGFCRDPHDAEDLVQDVLAALMRSVGSFRGEASLSTWAYVVARRACGRLRKRRSRQTDLDGPSSEPLLADVSTEPDRRLERRQLGAALEDAIGSLPAAQREVLILRDVEGLSAAEAGRVLGLGERALKSRLHRARLALRGILAPFVSGHDAPAAGRDCPDTARLLSRFIEGELTPDVCSRLEAHVNGCASCGGACDSLREVLGACRAYGDRPLPADLGRAVRKAIRRVVTTPGSGTTRSRAHSGAS
jgi:RNA polymerase sigma-70 factor (ECF subfamily)